MKTIPILILSFMLFLSQCTNTVNSQNANIINFNGWEFLTWSSNKNQVEDELQKRNISFNPGQPNQKSGPTTTFVFQNMKTRLAYDAGHLYDVQQHQYYGISEKEKAESAFTELKKNLIKKYGSPLVDKYDEKEKTLHLSWELKFTVVNLYYSGSDKPFQGFENQAYHIFLQANPK